MKNTEEEEELQLVVVEWVDSQVVQTTWSYLDELEEQKIARVCTAGYVVAETDEILTISNSVSYKDAFPTQVGLMINIPKCAITSRTKAVKGSS